MASRAARDSAPCEANVARAWERFIANEPIDAFRLRPTVIASWKRCRQNGVDPGIREARSTAVERQDPHNAGNFLSNALSACLPEYSQQLRGSCAAILAADADGKVVWMGGDSRLVGRLRSRWAMMGASWREHDLGTNAIGTSLAAGKVVTIEKHEHYCEVGKNWTCHAVPIRDLFDRSVIGVLDITHESSEIANQCRSQLLRIAGRLEEIVAGQISAEHAMIVARLDKMPAAKVRILAFDRAGRIVATRGDLSSFGLNVGQSIPALKGLIGAPHKPTEPASLSHDGDIDWLPDGMGGILRFRRPTPARHPRGLILLAPPLAAFAQTSPSLKPLAVDAQRYAERGIPLLLEGETGVGKEIFARAIHAAILPKSAPFLTIDCDVFGVVLDGNDPFERLRSVIGTAWDQSIRRPCSLFLDSVGDLPPELQSLLVKFLQRLEVSRICKNSWRATGMLVVASSGRSLNVDVSEHLFRSDLYHHFSVARFEVPPLRRRLTDLAPLTEALLTQIKSGDDRDLSLGEGVVQFMSDCRWPGNARELRNVLECMAASSPNGVLECDDLPTSIRAPSPSARAQHSEVVTDLRTIERQAIQSAMNWSGGRPAAAAKALGISKATIYRKLASFSKG
jgi:sigma-54 dependent transcriptional regulator, acetoin dehydrogenase operon transcriptional activator AcoR